MYVKKFSFVFQLVLTIYFCGNAQSQFDNIKSSLSVHNFNEDDYSENDLNDYLHFIINENSYQEAFKNFKNRNYKFGFSLEIDGLNDDILIDYKGNGTSKKRNKCRLNQFENKDIKGNYYRKNDRPKFYTAKLLETFAFGLEKNCDDKSPIIESRVEELVEILMSPGVAADLQFIGYKTDLFSSEMLKYYNYKISTSTYDNKVECVLFEMDLKPAFRERKKKKTIIKSLKSYYNKRTNITVAKEMVVSYKTPLQNYDINFNVEFDFINGKLLPKRIEYEGVWVVIPHRTEIGRFTIEYSNIFP